MILTEQIIAIVFLIILSVFDILTFQKREGYIPAILTTSFILIILIAVGPSVSVVYLALIGFILGMAFVDIDMFSGIADWKIIVACVITLSNVGIVLIFGLLIAGLSLPYKYLLKKSKFEEIPFIPLILISYLAILGLMMIG